jgi:hypothetical protein
MFCRQPRICIDAHGTKYDGPATAYKGVNICALFMETDIIYNLDALKLSTRSHTRSRPTFTKAGSEDHTTLYADDELDEEGSTTGTDFSPTCYIFDMTGLGRHHSATDTVYLTLVPTLRSTTIFYGKVKDGYIYQAAYTSGAPVKTDDMTRRSRAAF